MIGAFFSKIWGYIAATGAVTIGILFALLKIKDAQKDAAVAEKDKAEADRDRVIDINNENEKVRENEKVDEQAVRSTTEKIHGIVKDHNQNVPKRKVEDESSDKITIDNSWD